VSKSRYSTVLYYSTVHQSTTELKGWPRMQRQGKEAPGRAKAGPGKAAESRCWRVWDDLADSGSAAPA